MKNTPYTVVYILTKLELGGAQKVCLSLVQGLAEHNIPVHLITGSEGALADSARQLKGIIMLPSFKREIGGIFSELKNFFSLVKELRRLRKRCGTIIVHTHSTKAGLIGRWAALFAGARWRIHTVHGYGFHSEQNRLVRSLVIGLEWLTSLITTRFVCVAQKDQESGIKLFPAFQQKSLIIRAAVNSQHFFLPARKVAATPSITIGSIACFKPQKNLFDLLRAFQLARSELMNKQIDAKLEIIGDGALRTSLENWIQEQGLTSSITLLGRQDDVAPFLKRWDVFTLSSLWEGLPCSIIEARLSKLPIIAYNVGGISEVVANNKNGFLVPPHDYKALASALVKICKNPALRSRLSSHGEDLSPFSTASMIRSHIALYKNIAKDRT